MNTHPDQIATWELNDRIEAALKDLAAGCSDLAGVARKLLETGCTGDREKCGTCPVARWLYLKLGLNPLADSVYVTGPQAAVMLGHAVFSDYVRAPELVELFVSEFDGGQFGELQARS